MALAIHHLEVGRWQRNAGQAGGKAIAEVLFIHLLLQGDGRACVDEVPKHVEVLQDAVVVRIGLAILFIVEGFQLEAQLVNPSAALLH